MRQIKVVVCTNVTGSECEDLLEVPDDATDEFIEKEAKEVAMNMVEWYYDDADNFPDSQKRG